MNQFILLLIIIQLSLAWSHVQKKAAHIQIIDIEKNISNMQQVNLSQFTTNVRYILLEKVKGLELQSISKSDFMGDFILVSDSRICLLYDKNGKFISKIGERGRGPGEFNSTTNILLGKNSKILIQSLIDLNIYDFNGSFLNKYNKIFMINSEYISQWMQLNDSLFFGKVNRMSGQEKHKALIFNVRGGGKYYFNNYIFLNRKKPLAGPEEARANISSFQGGIYFKEWCNDTLFLMTEKFELKPVCNFYFGKYSQQYLQGEEDLPEYVSKLNNYIWIENIFQSTRYIFMDCNFNKFSPAVRLTPRIVNGDVSLNFNTTHILGVYDKKSKQLVFCNPTNTDNPLFTSGLYNDIDAGPRFFPMKQVNDSTMVMWIDAKQLKDHIASDDFKKNKPKYPEKKTELEKLANQLGELDNPLLMFVTFKN